SCRKFPDVSSVSSGRAQATFARERPPTRALLPRVCSYRRSNELRGETGEADRHRAESRRTRSGARSRNRRRSEQRLQSRYIHFRSHCSANVGVTALDFLVTHHELIFLQKKVPADLARNHKTERNNSNSRA